MPEAKKSNSLIKVVHDQRWIDFFYLKERVEGLMKKLHGLSFEFVADSREVPFNAQIRGYHGAMDPDGCLWLLKEIEEGTAFFYSLCELAYYLDFMLETLSAPTLLVPIKGVYYRATKVIVQATQISGYNYLEEPFRKVVANDLINRWLMFDEDRNPNNYMVLHNSKKEPLIVAIDFNHADLESEQMKVTGNPDQFGWHRTEKTRFLTLLKPDNFDVYGLDDFKRRLSLLMAISSTRLNKICQSLFAPIVPDAAKKARRITQNLVERREYINSYFKKWFGSKSSQATRHKVSEYDGLGKGFVDIYKKKI